MRTFLLFFLISAVALADHEAEPVKPPSVSSQEFHPSENLPSTNLFQNRFYVLDTTSKLECTDSKKEIFPLAKAKEAVDYYESQVKGLSGIAVKLLTDHINPELIKKVSKYSSICARSKNPDHCILAKYWGSEETATRVLALFYDTGTALQRSNASDFTGFSLSQVEAIEKSIQKIPSFLRKKVSPGKTLTLPGLRPPKVLVDGHVPFNMESDKDLQGNLAEVASGSNKIGFDTVKLDYAKSGSGMADIGYKFLADFRMQMIIHEIGHVVDAYNFPFINYPHFVSKNSKVNPIIMSSHAALWPSHWWEAFNEHPGIQNGRFELNEREKFAEFFAQYILLPKDLNKSAPEMYAWLRDNIFQGVEYEGYENCGHAPVRPLNRIEKLFAPSLLKSSHGITFDSKK